MEWGRQAARREGAVMSGVKAAKEGWMEELLRGNPWSPTTASSPLGPQESATQGSMDRNQPGDQVLDRCHLHLYLYLHRKG